MICTHERLMLLMLADLSLLEETLVWCQILAAT